MNSLSTVTTKGQITLPVHIRKASKIKPGDQVYFSTINVKGHTYHTYERIKKFSELKGSIPKPVGIFKPEDLSWV